jgi:LysM domain
LKIYPGDASGEAPPVPIPNTEVKLSSAEDTRGATSWENRSSPGYFTFNRVALTVLDGGGLVMLGPVDRVCPLLGLAGERGVTIDGVDAAHRCFAEDPPTPLERGLQAQLCLTAGHTRCERYLAFASRTGAATPGTARIGDGFVTTRLLLAPQPAWRGMAGRARTARATPWVVVGAGVAALGVASVAIAGPLLEDPGNEAARTSATPTASATPMPTPIATPTARPTPSPSPSPSSTPVPETPAPTPAPTPVVTPAPQQTYTVQEGDTLAAIAQQFGTSVEALQQANGIDDPDEIIVGQVLVIP